MNWLITGGCGFIGINLIAHLLDQDPDTSIRIVDNLSVGKKEDLSQVCNFTEIDSSTLSSSFFSDSLSPLNVELVVGDIKDYDACLNSCRGIDAIVHLAANTGVVPSVENPRKDMETNVIGTFNMLEAARRNRVKRFIFASSGAPVGEAEPPIHEELAPHPVSPYGASKLAGEAYCSVYAKTFGLETVSLRFGNAYGPRSKHKSSVVAKFIQLGMNGVTLEIYGDGKQTRDFIYIDDLVRAVLLAKAKDGIAGEVFQIASRAETSISELGYKLITILSDLGFKDIKFDHTSAKLGDVKRNFSDTSKAQKLLDWNVKVELEEGLKRTVQWFMDNRK